MNIKNNVLASVIVMAFAAVTGLTALPAAAAEPANGTGLYIDGDSVCNNTWGYGWKCENDVLTLTGDVSHRIMGSNTNGDVRIVVDCSPKDLEFWNVSITYKTGINAITFTENAKDAVLVLRGTNTIYGVSPANDTYEAICVDGGAHVTVKEYEGEGGVLCGGYDGGGQGTGRPTSNYRGVWVRDGGRLYWQSGTLSSYAATIGQTGGGIAIAKGGRMTIDHGTITNCYCNAGGGAIGVREGAVFNLWGGTIVDCHAGDTNATHVIHNAGSVDNAVLSGGTFDVHPLEHSANAVLKEHYTVRTSGNRYIVTPPYYHEPVYISPGDPASGIFCWKTNTVDPESCHFVLDVEREVTWDSGWYLLEKDAVRNGRITCGGNVRLILSDGATLTVNGGFGVPPNARLTIYAQEKGTGALKIRNIEDCRAGIGGAKDVPNGPITIHGGSVDVFSGQNGAAIGGGENAVGANIAINGGRVFANAIERGAGIGGGKGGMGTNITLNAGTVMAVAGAQKCAAIGGGKDAAGRDITINGGSVRTLAYSENNFIGGREDFGGNIRIAREATLVFCYVHDYNLLKSDYPTSTILLPEENVLTSRSLVCGAGPWDGPTAFVITNVATHAATDITVGGGTSILEKRAFELPAPSAQDDPLKLVVTPPPTTYLEPVYRTAGDPASGIDHWETNVTEKATFVTSSFYEVNWKSGWYVVEGDITIDGRIGCEGDVHLVLTDGATLTAKGGIVVSEDPNEGVAYSLTVYGQEEGTGTLLSYSPAEQQAGIGGYSGAVGNNITIHGGNVTAVGGKWAAGIGGGCNADGTNLVVNGGTVMAQGGALAAGIGGGGEYRGGNGIVVNGGTIVAEGGELAAGIGGGDKGASNGIVLNGGTITAIGGKKGGTAIGGGDKGVGRDIRFNGGTVYPIVEKGEIFIGNSAAVKKTDECSVVLKDEAILVFNLTDEAFPSVPGDITNSTIFVRDYPTPRKLIGGLKQASGRAKNFTARCPKTGDIAELAAGGDTVPCGHRRLALTAVGEPTFELQVFGEAVTFRVPVYRKPGDPKSGIDHWEEVTKQPRETTLLNIATNVVLKDGWYVADRYLNYTDRIQCQGDVHLILKDGCILTAENGVRVTLAEAGITNSLTIYGEKENTGLLDAHCADWKKSSHSAGIGSDYTETSGSITINGGTIEARGSYWSAGIGSGGGGTGRGIVVNGGRVKAIGGGWGAGIGGGNRGEGKNIVINGGYVMAQGGEEGTAAIGGGNWAFARDIYVNGGTVLVSVRRAHVEDAMTPSLIGSAAGKPPPINIRIAEDVILVYDLAFDPARTFPVTYDRPTIITSNSTGSRCAAMGVVPDSNGDWTGPQVFALTNLDTHATAEAYVNGPAVDYSGAKYRVAYRSGPGSLVFLTSTRATGVFIDGKEVGAIYQPDEIWKMGWKYDRTNCVVHIDETAHTDDFTVEGINVDSEVRFEITSPFTRLVLKDLTLIHTNGVNVFDFRKASNSSSVVLTGTNIISAEPPAGQTNAVFCVRDTSAVRVMEGAGTLIGNGKENFCAMRVYDDACISMESGTLLNFPVIGINNSPLERAGMFFAGVFDRHPLENSYRFTFWDTSGIFEEDGYFYVYWHWYEEPVYNTPGDPASGINHWEKRAFRERFYDHIVTPSEEGEVVWGTEGRTVWALADTGTYSSFTNGVSYVGDVRLLLASNAVVSICGKGLNAKTPDSKLTIYGEGYADHYPSGTLEIINIADGYAAIGGVKGADGHNITINGGNLDVMTRSKAATIGGGEGGTASNIVVNAGNLTLAAGIDAAVIGGSASNNAFGIVINGGTVTDYVPERSAGIGCGKGCKEVWPAGNRNLVINGGSVTAFVGDDTHKPSKTLYRIVDRLDDTPGYGPLEITGLGDYGVKDIIPIKLTEGPFQLTFHLPNPSGTYWVNGVCHAYGNGEASKAKPYSPEAAGPFATEAQARAYAATAYVPRPNKDVEGVISPADYNAMFKFIFRESANTTWYVEPVLKDEVIKDVTETIENKDVTALLAASVTNDKPATEVKTRAGLYYGIGGSTDVKDVGTVPTWLLGDGKIQTLEGAKPGAATDKAFYRIRVTPTP